MAARRGQSRAHEGHRRPGANRADFVITSGEIALRQDDLTREIIAEVRGRKLVRACLLDQVDRCPQHDHDTPNNEPQADIPEGAIPVENRNGIALSLR